ncbi:MAG: MBL fold metallo-hydrolase [Planctomycetes bacterium]|nr:MBL fold metallo-hydrolase [Planctomycetota bacterium]MBL7153228.1 MBL fold metallo-hydrolase [Phycisphaerae bacterium]
MQLKLRFLGAAQNVTGSRHLFEANGTRVLVDCGFYQERKFKARNWEPFVVPPNTIDAVLLTHAHLDHCGLLPKLVREGFKGRIHCTAATAEIAQIILLDSAKIQEEDAKYKRRRHEKEGRKSPYPYDPLYTATDAENTFPHFSPVKYGKTVQVGPGVEATFCDAGHVLGSSVIRIKAKADGEERTVLFSGDIGRPGRPILQDPVRLDHADYVLVESTYGDRVHQGRHDTKRAIADVINAAKKAGGTIIVPSFALERSQDLLYYINELLREGAIPHINVFLDSPMAAGITKVFKHHPELYDEEMTEFMANHESPFNFPGLKITRSTKESKAINHKRGTLMVIAGSGMCTGGRVKHHLVNNITDPKNTIMFVGYQASGTLGRRIVNGEKEVRILGREYPVKAKIAKIGGFSAHADKEELLNWLRELKKPPRTLFVVHGEESSAKHFGDYVRKETGWNVEVPAYQDEFILD